MRSRHQFWMLLAAAHTILVICGACDFLPDGDRQPFAQPLLWYARFSGADNQFPFYAPNVGDHIRTRFTLEDAQGGTCTASFEEPRSPEAQLRLSGITEAAFGNRDAEESPERRIRLIKSWAATMFSRHPSAVALMVFVEAYDVPTMAEYREGRRPSWKLMYQARVLRSTSVQHVGAPP